MTLARVTRRLLFNLHLGVRVTSSSATPTHTSPESSAPSRVSSSSATAETSGVATASKTPL